MTKFDVGQIRLFLETLDKHLSAPVQITIIGGSAALLQHGARSPTRDIDTFECDPRAIRQAAAKAQLEIGFSVPIQNAAIADLPLNYETRLLHPLPHLKRLHVAVPDRYDLVLSKLVRATQPDLDVCKEIHRAKALDPIVLVERYLAEMKHAIGRAPDHDQNLLTAVDFIWDSTTADRIERRIAESRRIG